MYPSFLALALKRIRERWALTLLSLIGIALTVGLIASIPIFTDAVGLNILQGQLAEQAFGNGNPPVAIRYYRLPSDPDPMTVQQALDTGAWLGQLTTREVGLPVARSYMQIGSHGFIMRALEEDTRYSEKEMRQVRVNCVPNIEDQIEITEGLPFSQADTANELLLWARPEFLAKLGVQVGEVFELYSENSVHLGDKLRFRIAGAWQAKDPNGLFWYRDPQDLMGEEFLTSVGAFGRFIAPYMPQQTDFVFWYYVLDETRIRFDRVDDYTLGVQHAELKAQQVLPRLRVDRSPLDPLKIVQLRTRILKQLLIGFSLPVVVLLLFFVALIAVITVRYQRNEVAILMSRGAGRLQVLGISTLEGLVHIALGTPLGILLSLTFARSMSLASGFLAFGRRIPLPVASYALDGRLVALALLVSLLARVLPALSSARLTIVSYGHERARSGRINLLLRLLLTVVLLAATGYAGYRLYVRGTLGLVSWEPQTGVVTNDPLLFMAPTLFIVSAALLAAQLFPFFMRLLDLVGRLLPGTTLYLGLKNLARESGPYAIPLFLVITCLSLGSFEASIARSSDVWLVDRWRYQVGADYSFAQTTIEDGSGLIKGQDAWLLPVETYHSLPGVTDATRVGDFQVISLGGSITVDRHEKFRLMGVDRFDFPRVAYFRDDYTQVSLGELLNRLGAQPNGVLVSPRFLRETGLSVGDNLMLDAMVNFQSQHFEFVIVGTYDYFPTVYEAAVTSAPEAQSGGRQAADSTADNADLYPGNTVIIGNLDYIFNQCGGPAPHSIWLRTTPDMDELKLKEALDKMNVATMNELNGRALSLEDQQRLERVGIYGNLSVGFLSGSALACMGVLVYTLAALVGRLHRFAILRAVGLDTSQLLITLSVEYLGVIIYGILVGAVAGVATARFFVPYFQFTEDPSMMVPPFTPYIAWSQILWIIVGYFVVLSVAELIILARATRRKVFQALRLGFQE